MLELRGGISNVPSRFGMLQQCYKPHLISNTDSKVHENVFGVLRATHLNRLHSSRVSLRPRNVFPSHCCRLLKVANNPAVFTERSKVFEALQSRCTRGQRPDTRAYEAYIQSMVRELPQRFSRFATILSERNYIAQFFSIPSSFDNVLVRAT